MTDTNLTKCLLFASILLLGMPLNGVIPAPVDSGDIVQPDNSRKLTVAVVWSTIYFAALVLCLRRLGSTLVILSRHWPLFGLAAWLLLSSMWSPSPSSALVLCAQIVGSMVLATAVAAYLRHQTRVVVNTITLALGVSVLVSGLATILIPGSTIATDGGWAGVTGSPNYLGSISAASVCLSLVAFFFSGNVVFRYVAALLHAASWVVLLKTGSATSLIAAASVVGWILYQAAVRTLRVGVVGQWLFTAIVITIGFTLFSLGAHYSGLELLGKETSLSGRTTFWQAAFDLIGARPLVGHGVGSDTLSLGALPWATSFHNGYVDLIVRGGSIAGMLLFTWLAVIVKQVMWRPSKQGPVAIALSSVILLALVHNIAESSFMMSRSPIWLCLIVSCFALLPPAATNTLRRTANTKPRSCI